MSTPPDRPVSARILDWDLWPWMIAEQAGSLSMYRLERMTRRLTAMLGLAFLPAQRAAAAAFREFTNRRLRAALEALPE